MGFEEIWNEYTSSEKDMFQKSVRRLLKQTFIVRDRDEDSKKAYYFVSKRSEPFSAYLGYIGYDIVIDRENGVIMLQNCRDLNEMESAESTMLDTQKDGECGLCCLWTLYADRVRSGNLSKNIEISVTDLRYEMEKYGIRDQIDKSSFASILTLFTKYQLLQVIGKLGEEDCRICLYPSMQFVLEPQEFGKFVENVNRRMQEKWSREDEWETERSKERRTAMKNQTIMNRKSAKKLLMVQWSRFQNVCIELEGSTLVTGVNGSGKSTVLDAMTYLLTGNTQFNTAAKDRDRTVLGYVRGDTRSNGEARYLRNGSVVSYSAMEFSDPTLGQPLTVGVCSESPSESGKPVSSWFICPGAAIDDIDFTRIEGNALRITPKNELTVNGEAMKLSSFMGRDRGTEAVLRALGLRVDAVKCRTKLLKMMAFNPENNIDQFIQDCVRNRKVSRWRNCASRSASLSACGNSMRVSDRAKSSSRCFARSDEYEKKKRVLRIRELMLSYQALREKEEEEKLTKNRYQALKDQYGRLTERAGELARQQEAAQERLRIAENNDMVKGMQESLDSLKRQIEEADREKKNWEDKLAQILKLKKKISALIKLLEADLPSLSSENTYLETLEQADGETAKKREAFDAFREKVHRQDGIYEENKIHLQDQCKEREKEIGALQEKIRRLESNILVFPAEVENARNKIQRG